MTWVPASLRRSMGGIKLPPFDVSLVRCVEPPVSVAWPTNALIVTVGVSSSRRAMLSGGAMSLAQTAASAADGLDELKRPRSGRSGRKSVLATAKRGDAPGIATRPAQNGSTLQCERSRNQCGLDRRAPSVKVLEHPPAKCCKAHHRHEDDHICKHPSLLLLLIVISNRFNIGSLVVWARTDHPQTSTPSPALPGAIVT